MARQNPKAPEDRFGNLGRRGLGSKTRIQITYLSAMPGSPDSSVNSPECLRGREIPKGLEHRFREEGLGYETRNEITNELANFVNKVIRDTFLLFQLRQLG